jgi:hypothetical protein
MRAFVLVLAGVAVFGGRPEGPVSNSAAEQTGRLHVGQTLQLEDASATLTFTGVRGDSRCPKNARCIRAGEADVALELREKSGQASMLTFRVPPGGSATQTSHEVRIEIVSLDPQTESGVEIAQDDYIVTLKVSPS